MAYKHGHCVIPTVVRLKPRETLPEPEWSPLGGTRLFFFHCLDSMFPVVSSAGSNQETEIHENLTSSFYRSNNEMSSKSKDEHPSHCFSCGQALGEGRWLEGRQFMSMLNRSGTANETLQVHTDTFEAGAQWTCIGLVFIDLF